MAAQAKATGNILIGAEKGGIGGGAKSEGGSSTCCAPEI